MLKKLTSNCQILIWPSDEVETKHVFLFGEINLSSALTLFSWAVHFIIVLSFEISYIDIVFSSLPIAIKSFWNILIKLI